jgi:hypothetical protein
MTDTKESVHAAKLLELGFAKWEPPPNYGPMTATPTEDEESEDEKSAPVYTPRSEPPYFTQMGDGMTFEITIAVDETGQKWTARKHIDLTFLGFSNPFEQHPLQ